MSELDLALQIFSILRQLAERPNQAITSALDAVTSGAVGQLQRIQVEAKRFVDEATTAAATALDAAKAAVTSAEAALDTAKQQATGALADAQRAIDDATTQGTQAVQAATQQADRMRANALAAALDPQQLADAEARARKLVDDAQAAAAKLLAQAQAGLAKVTSAAEQAAAAAKKIVDDATASAAELQTQLTDLVDQAQQQIATKVAELTQAAQNALGQVAAFPDRATALAEDAQRAVAGAIGNTGNLIGLIAQALVYLKSTLFPDEPAFQVVAYRDPSDTTKPGIGLSWIQGGVTALFAYVPELGTPLGTFAAKIETLNGQPATCTLGSRFHVDLTVSGTQQLTIPLGGAPVPATDGSIGLALVLDTSGVTPRLPSFLTASPGTPHVTLGLRAAGGQWHYQLGAELAGVSWGVDLAKLLDPIPNLLGLDDFREQRTFGLMLADGQFTMRETVAS